MKIIFTLLGSAFLLGCSEKQHVRIETSEWYRPWIEEDIEAGARFHSEFPLGAGEVRKVPIQSDRNLTVGLVVMDGYEVSRAKGSIYLGTEQEPHRASGSPGFSQAFEPVDGVIHLRIENTTDLNTRVALHTK